MDKDTVLRYRVWLSVCIFGLIILGKILVGLDKDNIIGWGVVSSLITILFMSAAALRVALRDRDKH